MVVLMGWVQIASAKQMCDYVQLQIKTEVMKATPSCNTDLEADSDSESFFLRGPIEEEIHHPKAFFYKPNLNVITIISFPRLNHLFAQVSIFEQIKPPCYS